ncbi:hypothetical protein RhiirC2_798623 [Rhizophagus irregularis]|uniref:DNA-directed DNA polymerase n=1 Tax=Rhizophagus irregularis TaxID=588596 RepID=A0A2N1M6A3_9GLOM|nr:hypothetical protein RhiirC2_798623 [Rhizophagus irregularis]
MSGLLSSITGALGRLFGNLWGGPTPPELPEPSKPPAPEEPEVDSDGESDYETALTCQNTQNTKTRCTQWIGSENDFRVLSRDYFLIKANSKETLHGGQIDLRKTGTYASTSLCYFQDVARYPRKTEDLSQEEDHWIKLAYIGNLTWAEPYEGIATELDFNEFYPNLLANGMTGWPIGPGYYTHHDLKLAIDLGLHIELSSESSNALIYGQNNLMSGHDIFYQWASYLTTIKNKGGQAGKVAKHMLQRDEKLYQKKLGHYIWECVNRIHTDGYIISGKATDQKLEQEYAGGWRELKIVKTGFISIKNVMRLEWTNFEEIISATSTNSKKSTIRYITTMSNEILKNEGEKLYFLLLVNKQWYYNARRLIWQKIVLTGISGIKFTKALSKEMKSDACSQVLGLKFIGEINIEPDVYISEVCKACPNF